MLLLERMKMKATAAARPCSLVVEWKFICWPTPTDRPVALLLFPLGLLLFHHQQHSLTHFIHSTACLFMQITHAKCLPACLAVYYLLSSCELDAAAAAVIPLVPESSPKCWTTSSKFQQSALFLLEDRWQRTLLVAGRKSGASTAFLLYFSVSTSSSSSSSSLCTQIRHSVLLYSRVRLFQPAALCLLYNRINLLNKTAEEKVW